jgi:hypothetical protein
MAKEYWKPGWQENSFARLREHITSSPAWFQHLSPSDTAEDAYLLTFASTLFLKDEVGSNPVLSPQALGPRPEPKRPRPVGVPAFAYERCLTPGQESFMAYDAALSGRLGALHRDAARIAGSREAWCEALSDLHAHRALRQEFPADVRRHAPRLAPFGEDLRDCVQAVFRKALHAIRIGFGLWGRWESA